MTTQKNIAALISVCAFTAAITTVPANAGETAITQSASGYQMAAVIDRARGGAVMAGDYSEAIAKLGDSSRMGFESSTNLCVAYTMTGELDNANRACTAALALSERSNIRRDIAVALSNLGVVKAVKGDLSGARRDFTRALELKSDLRQAGENLERLRGVAVTDA